MFRWILLAFLLSAVPAGADTADATLRDVVADARDGRIDVCRDARWPAWRFSQTDRARFVALKALVAEAVDDADARVRDERMRLRAFNTILEALDEAKSRAGWTAASARAETSYLNWRARAAARSGDDLPSMLVRRALWRLAGARMYEERVPAPVAARIWACFAAHDRSDAERAVENYLTGALDRGRFPNDAEDGNGASTAVLALPDSPFGARYVEEHWQPLSGGIAPSGVVPLWRVLLALDTAPPPSIDAFAARFDTEWPQVGAMLDALAPPSNVGEELYRRTRLEQFGRSLLGVVSARFGSDPQRGRVFTSMWERISAVDAGNTARLKALLESRDWFDDARDGDGAEIYGWLIAQHSDDDPAFQREVLARMERLLPTGRVRRRNFAYLWDRVALADKKPQRYGTQYTCKDAKWVLSPTEDPKRLDARRKSMGMEPATATLPGTCG